MMDPSKATPLDDLERFELLQAMYPDRLGDDADLGDEEGVLEEIGVDPETFDELMGRVVLLSMPMHSPLTGRAHHVLGTVTITADGNAHMAAAVKRVVAAH